MLAEGEAAPVSRQEGDAIIVPIAEERAVVVKKLFVVEELVLRFIPTQQPFRQEVEIRRQRVSTAEEYWSAMAG